MIIRGTYPRGPNEPFFLNNRRYTAIQTLGALYPHCQSGVSCWQNMRMCHKSSKIGSEEWSLSEVSVVIPRDLCNFFRHCHDSERLGRRVDGEFDSCPAREQLLLPDVYRPQRGRRQVVLQLAIMQRPLGPRVMTSRSSSSDLPTPPLPPIPQKKIPSPLSTKSPAPSLSLNIPCPPRFPDIGSQTLDSGDDSPLFGSYYGRPFPPSNPGSTNLETANVRPIPPSLNFDTWIPQELPTSSKSRVIAKGLLDNLNDSMTWSEEVLEVISRLGEGAGGAVHGVRDKRTGKIMARKSITTREAATKQLLRELSIISSIQHINIIDFYGAYMSPSSSEVEVLMALCEGGSLETVGKRIKERGAIVGELVTGRLAEGVMPFPITVL